VSTAGASAHPTVANAATATGSGAVCATRRPVRRSGTVSASRSAGSRSVTRKPTTTTAATTATAATLTAAMSTAPHTTPTASPAVGANTNGFRDRHSASVATTSVTPATPPTSPDAPSELDTRTSLRWRYHSSVVTDNGSGEITPTPTSAVQYCWIRSCRCATASPGSATTNKPSAFVVAWVWLAWT